jgi:hypothetical protein
MILDEPIHQIVKTELENLKLLRHKISWAAVEMIDLPTESTSEGVLAPFAR